MSKDLSSAAVLEKAKEQLAGLEQPMLEAEVLLAHVLGLTRGQLLSLPERELNEAQRMQFTHLTERRLQGEPVAYLTGHREFWVHDLLVTPDVLIPRPETELLVELALQKIPIDVAWRIADLGTGSGAIALAIASERRHCQIVATDISEAALKIARANAERLAIRNVEFRLGASDWFGTLQNEYFDMIVSNPPYVRSDDVHLQELHFEPQIALVAGVGGLQHLRDIATRAREHFTPTLTPFALRHPYSAQKSSQARSGLAFGSFTASPHQGGGGDLLSAHDSILLSFRERDGVREDRWLLLEHGYDQGSELLRMLTDLGYACAQDYTDLAGVPRIAIAQWKTPDE